MTKQQRQATSDYWLSSLCSASTSGLMSSSSTSTSAVTAPILTASLMCDIQWYRCVRTDESFARRSKKAETKEIGQQLEWINERLVVDEQLRQLEIRDLADFGDGLKLVYLLELLYKVTLKKELNCRVKLHKIENFDSCIGFMQVERNCKCVGINSYDLVDCKNVKMMLGFLFIVKHDYEGKYLVELSRVRISPCPKSDNDDNDSSSVFYSSPDDKSPLTSSSVSSASFRLSNSSPVQYYVEPDLDHQTEQALVKFMFSSSSSVSETSQNDHDDDRGSVSKLNDVNTTTSPIDDEPYEMCLVEPVETNPNNNLKQPLDSIDVVCHEAQIIEPQCIVECQILDAETSEPLANANETIVEPSQQELHSTMHQVEIQEQNKTPAKVEIVEISSESTPIENEPEIEKNNQTNDCTVHKVQIIEQNTTPGKVQVDEISQESIPIENQPEIKQQLEKNDQVNDQIKIQEQKITPDQVEFKPEIKQQLEKNDDAVHEVEIQEQSTTPAKVEIVEISPESIKIENEPKMKQELDKNNQTNDCTVHKVQIIEQNTTPGKVQVDEISQESTPIQNEPEIKQQIENKYEEEENHGQPNTAYNTIYTPQNSYDETFANESDTDSTLNGARNLNTICSQQLETIEKELMKLEAEPDENQDRPMGQLDKDREPTLNDELKVQETKTIHNEPEIEDLVTEHDKQLHEKVHDKSQSQTAESLTFDSTRLESTQSDQPTSANESQNSHDESSNSLRNDATSNTSVEKADKLIENEPSKPDNIAQTNEQSHENDDKTAPVSCESNGKSEKQSTEPTQTTPQIDHADQNGIYDDNNNNIQKVTIEEPKPNRTNSTGKKASKKDKNRQSQPPKQHQQPVEQLKKVDDQRHESIEQQTPTNEAEKVAKEAEKIENKPITVEENTSKPVESSKNDADQPTTTNQSSKSNKNKAKSNKSNKISKQSVTKEADADESKPTPPAAPANTAPVAEIETKQADTSSELLSNKPMTESQQPKTDQTSAQTQTDNKKKTNTNNNERPTAANTSADLPLSSNKPLEHQQNGQINEPPKTSARKVKKSQPQPPAAINIPNNNLPVKRSYTVQILIGLALLIALVITLLSLKTI